METAIRELLVENRLVAGSNPARRAKLNQLVMLTLKLREFGLIFDPTTFRATFCTPASQQAGGALL
jgi:hypothetical protein